MRGLDLVDVVALACDLWDCEPDQALARLDVAAIEETLAEVADLVADVSERPTTRDRDALADLALHADRAVDRGAATAQGVPAVALAGAAVIRGVLANKIAGDGSAGLALRTLMLLLARNDTELADTGDLTNLHAIFESLTSGECGVETAAWWLSRLFAPFGRVDSEAPLAGAPVWVDACPTSLSVEARRAVEHAATAAAHLSHDGIACAHLLIGVAATPSSDGGRILAAATIDVAEANHQLAQLVRPGSASEGAPKPLTPGATAAIERAAAVARSAGSPEIGTEHLLSALLSASDDPVAMVIDRIADRAWLQRVTEDVIEGREPGDYTFADQPERLPVFTVEEPEPSRPEPGEEDALQVAARSAIEHAVPSPHGNVQLVGVDCVDGEVVVTVETSRPGAVTTAASRIRAQLRTLLGTEAVRLRIVRVAEDWPVAGEGARCSFCGLPAAPGRPVAMANGSGICKRCHIHVHLFHRPSGRRF